MEHFDEIQPEELTDLENCSHALSVLERDLGRATRRAETLEAGLQAMRTEAEEQVELLSALIERYRDTDRSYSLGLMAEVKVHRGVIRTVNALLNDTK